MPPARCPVSQANHSARPIRNPSSATSILRRRGADRDHDPARRRLGQAVPLPDGFAAIEVDDVGRHVFVSSPTENVVSVLDLDGRLVHTIEGIAGPGALLADGDRLFMASTTGGRIDVVDAATFQPVTRYGEGLLIRPQTLVKAGGRLWTTTDGCGESDDGRLVSIDPGTGATAVNPAIEELEGDDRRLRGLPLSRWGAYAQDMVRLLRVGVLLVMTFVKSSRSLSPLRDPRPDRRRR